MFIRVSPYKTTVRAHKKAFNAKIKLFEGSKNRIKLEQINIMVRPINASFIDTSPFAIGLFFVLSTLLSNFLSVISLIIHPADLIKIEPDKNKNK